MLEKGSSRISMHCEGRSQGLQSHQPRTLSVPHAGCNRATSLGHQCKGWNPCRVPHPRPVFVHLLEMVGVWAISILGTCTHDVRLAQLCSRAGHSPLAKWLGVPGFAPPRPGTSSVQPARSAQSKWPALALHIAMSHVKTKHISVWKWWAPGMARELECVICPGPGPDGAQPAHSQPRPEGLPRSSKGSAKT